MGNLVVELDIDGVIADIHNALNVGVKNEFGIDFVGDRDIFSWGMSELDPAVRKYILGLFNTVDFIRDLQVFEGVDEVLKDLDKTVKGMGGVLQFNTNVLPNCVEVRKQWIRELLGRCGLDCEYTVVTTGGVKTMLACSDIVVDDNYDNLALSNARFKVLMRRGHNRAYTLRDMYKIINKNKPHAQIFIINSLEELKIILYLYKLLVLKESVQCVYD